MKNTAIQSVINVLYRYPKGYIRKVSWYGGPVKYYQMLSQKAKMQLAAQKLKPVHSYKEGLSIYFLTGKNYLYQTLFCISSLVNCSNVKFNFVLVDDGSFNDELINLIHTMVPGATIVTAQQIKLNLEKVIPESAFPVLHHKRSVYGHLKKLTDIHTIPDDQWKIVFDSDMLFWQEPSAIIDWLNNPTQNIYMQDYKTSYGYSTSLIEQLCGEIVPEKLNAGIVGLKSESINWRKVEDWITDLEAAGGSTFLLEQALTAMIFGQTDVVVLSDAEYIVNPSETQIVEKAGIMQHFVDFSKRDYFLYAWKDLLK